MIPLVSAGPALFAGLVLFLVPGLLFLALLPSRDREALPLDEALFLAAGASVAGSAWLCLLLAELGAFSLLRAAAIVLAAAAVVALLFRGRLGANLGPTAPRVLWPAAAVLALALLFQTRPSEYLLGGRDPGTYVAAMALIARTGGVAYVDPVVRSIPSEDTELFYRDPTDAALFKGMPMGRPESGRVVPENFHLFPAFGACLFQSMGVRGALATPCVFGVLGTLAVFFAWRRVFGPVPALLAALLLAVNVVQVWFARYPASEPMSQFLLFLGLLAFAHWEERDSVAFGALAGTAFGLALLVRIDNILLVVPLGLYVLVRRAQGELPWRRTWPVVVPLALLAAHTVVHAAFWARKYTLNIVNRPYWHRPWWVWLVVALAAAALLRIVHRLEPRVVRWVDAHGDAARRAAVAGLVLLAAYAYFVRPRLSAWAGADGNATPPLAHAGWLRALGFHRLAAHDAQSLVRLGWFVSPLVLVLAILGTAEVIRHGQRRYLLPILTAATVTGFYLYKIRVTNDYYFGLRRYVPMVIPALLGLAALCLVRLAARGGLGRVAAAFLFALVASLYLRDTLPLFRYRDWPGAVRFVDDVARRFGPDDVVIFEQPRSIHLLSLPLWAAYGVHALELARFDPDPVRLRHLVESWRGRYRNVYFVHTYSTDLCGLFLQRVEDLSFGSFEWERAYDHKPRHQDPRALHFRISRVVDPEALQVPPLREVDVGGSDDFQVSGFFDKEGLGSRSYRWTGRCASVYLPGARASDTVVVTAATGQRPAPPPAIVRVSIGGTALGTFEATTSWGDHALRLPAPLPIGPALLRLDVPAWRPANVLADTTDFRDLGIMVDRIRLQAGPEKSAEEPDSRRRSGGGRMRVSPAAGGSP